ncbi:MAG: copper resistance protein CopC [Chloroflexota bacterium]|nr:copper resistance protein CopC [Chloroflexota bacterium]
MTVTHQVRLASAVVITLVLLLVDALPTAAHAELMSADQADKAEFQAPFSGPIVLTFSEALASGSKAELKAPGGATVGAATVDGTKLVFTLGGPLSPGPYTILWTSVAADRDILRGTLTFSVVAPPPTPTPAPTATPGATASPPGSPNLTASPTPSGNGTPSSATGDVILPLLAAVVAVGAIGAFLLRNRRSAGR